MPRPIVVLAALLALFAVVAGIVLNTFFWLVLIVAVLVLLIGRFVPKAAEPPRSWSWWRTRRRAS